MKSLVLLASISLISVASHAATDPSPVSMHCRLRANLADRNAAAKDFQFKAVKEEWDIQLKGDEKIKQFEGGHLVPGTPYTFKYTLTAAPESFGKPESSIWLNSLDLIRWDGLNRQTLIGSYADHSFYGFANDPKSNIEVAVDIENPDFMNEIIAQGYKLDDALLIPTAGDSRMSDLIKSGKIADGSLFSLSFFCAYKQAK